MNDSMWRLASDGVSWLCARRCDDGFIGARARRRGDSFFGGTMRPLAVKSLEEAFAYLDSLA